MFETFITSLTSLVNLGALLFLFLYMYAVLGMYLFADVMLTSPLN